METKEKARITQKTNFQLYLYKGSDSNRHKGDFSLMNIKLALREKTALLKTRFGNQLCKRIEKHF